jgi:hypothetical protein
LNHCGNSFLCGTAQHRKKNASFSDKYPLVKNSGPLFKFSALNCYGDKEKSAVFAKQSELKIQDITVA